LSVAVFNVSKCLLRWSSRDLSLFGGLFDAFIDVNSLGAVALLVVIALAAGVGLLALLAEFSSHDSPLGREVDVER